MEPNNTPAQNENGSASDKSTAKQGKKVGIGIAIVAILALIGITVASKKPATQDSTPVDTGTSSATPATTGTAVATTAPTSTGTAEYKDGTYTATGSYMSPGGPDKVGVSVTLNNDIITAATVTPMPGDQESAHYQAIFAANYKQYVVGQDITKLNVHKVSGSSLTSGGFNDAISQIEAQAKA
jgi:uncharacterized protein with FMN-binding domain